MKELTLENKLYTIRKLGNRDRAEAYNQDVEYTYHGLLSNDDRKIALDNAVFIGGFNTSRLRSIYKYQEGDTLESITESVPATADLVIPGDLKEGDLVLGTMNSVYLLTDLKPELNMEIGYHGDGGFFMGIKEYNDTPVEEREQYLLKRYKDYL